MQNRKPQPKIHRVIIGKPYYEAFGLDPRDAVARVFAFLLRKKVCRTAPKAP